MNSSKDNKKVEDFSKNKKLNDKKFKVSFNDKQSSKSNFLQFLDNPKVIKSLFNDHEIINN